MIKTFKYRIYPKKSQRSALQGSLDACRWVYNKTLEVRRDTWENDGKSLSLYDTHNFLKPWKEEEPWLAEQAFSQSLQNAQARVDLAFNAFFRRVKAGDKPGYPRFRGVDRYDSFTFTQKGFKLIDDKYLRISKVGIVRIKLHRPIDGKIKTLTIGRNRLGYWYASFNVEVEPKRLQLTDKCVGIDLGLMTFATMSDGSKIERQRWFKQDEKDLTKMQRKISALQKGSKKRKHMIRSLNHIYQRIFYRRSDFSHKESRKLVNKYQIIVFEDLDIADMQSGNWKTINRSIADVAWSQFVRHTVAKAEEAGRTVVLVDPKNTSQMCSGCGQIVKKDLHVRIHNCPHCGLKIDRDFNASINILRRGLASLGESQKSSPLWRGAQSQHECSGILKVN